MQKLANSLIKIFQKQTKLIVGLVVGAVVSSSVAVVMAAIPDVTGVIHGCYAPGGQLSVINSPTQTCKKGDTAISWNSATPGQFVTNLVGADFTNTSLAYRNFIGADLHGAIFANTIFTGANFSNSNLSFTQFTSPTVARNAIFTGTNFSSANLSGGYDFTGTSLERANFTNAVFDGANGTNVTGGDFQGANFNNVLLSGVFNGSNFHSVDFRAITTEIASRTDQLQFNFHVDLTNANLSGISMLAFSAAQGGADFTNTNFSNSTLNQVDMQLEDHSSGINFTNAHITNSFFNGTDLSSAILTGTTWSNTVCPDNTNSDNNGNTCIGHLVP